MTQQEILQRIKSCVHDVESSAEVILYGSQARGDAGEESDWDILIVVERELSFQARRDLESKLFYDIILPLNIPLSTIIRSREGWTSPLMQATPFAVNVRREGVVL